MVLGEIGLCSQDAINIHKAGYKMETEVPKSRNNQHSLQSSAKTP
jgi:hypothetical protein